MRMAVSCSMLAAGLLTSALSQASDVKVETSHLIVSDDTGSLSDEHLRRLAGHAQETLNKILAFWSAGYRTERFGKIRIIFDAPRGDLYSSVFYFDRRDGQTIRAVRVSGVEGSPQMMAHKLTSAVFPHKDKLTHNIMGTVAEAQVGNPLTFPGCGFLSDEWVLAFAGTQSLIPLDKLGPDNESWGMRDAGGGRMVPFDRAMHFRTYAESASFGNYLFRAYGIDKIKQYYRLSIQQERPWRQVFGIGLQGLEATWLNSLKAGTDAREENVSMAATLFAKDPATACLEAQKIVSGKR